jgi:hypothetical protein
MFRFTIRDVLWLTIVVALAISWWVDNKRIENTVVRLEKEGRLQREAREVQLTILRERAAELHKIVEERRRSNPSIVNRPPPRTPPEPNP